MSWSGSRAEIIRNRTNALVQLKASNDSTLKALIDSEMAKLYEIAIKIEAQELKENSLDSASFE